MGIEVVNVRNYEGAVFYVGRKSSLHRVKGQVVDMSILGNPFSRNGREKDVALSPAYDLLPTALLLPEDREETALAINGRKRKLGRQDMLKLGKSLRLTERQSTNALRRFEEKLPAALRLIASGFCGEDQKLRYEALIRERSERLLG